MSPDGGAVGSGRTLAILDVQYLFSSTSHKHKWLDLRKLVALLKETHGVGEGDLEIRAYTLNNREGSSPIGKILMEEGCEVSARQVTGKPSNAYSGAHDVRITLDVMDRISTFDTIVLMSGKTGYTDLVQRLHIYNKDVRVWGFEWSMSKFLRSSADIAVFLEKEDGVIQESRR